MPVLGDAPETSPTRRAVCLLLATLATSLMLTACDSDDSPSAPQAGEGSDGSDAGTDSGTPDAGQGDAGADPDPDPDPDPDGGDAATPVSTTCPDADDDGFRDAACGGRDCDDDDDSVHPDADEVCDNGIDDDCNPATGDLGDRDGDGVGCADDCDDSDDAVFPGAPERCGNDVDDDCDPNTADVFDADSDGQDCDVDCDDGNPAVLGSAEEICDNGIDDDCDPATPDLFDVDGDKISCQLDCDDSDAALPNSAFFCGNDYAYYATFDEGDEGWVADMDSSWNRGRARNAKFQAEDHIGWFTQGNTDFSTLYATDEDSALTSPALDFSALGRDPVLQFDRVVSFGIGGEVRLQVSTDGGFVWQDLAPSEIDQNLYDENNRDAFNDRRQQPQWARTRALLTGTAGQAAVRVRFLLGTNIATDAGFGLDNVSISTTAWDAEIVSVTLPPDGCGEARRTAEVIVTVKNNSAAPIVDVPLTIVDDQGTLIEETIPGPIETGARVLHTVATPFDLSAVRTHAIIAAVGLPGDQVGDNDSRESDTHTFPILSPGQLEDFETDDGAWHARGALSTWRWGTPAGDRIDGAASGSRAWVTNPIGVHNPAEQSRITSPCWNFAGASTDPVLAFALAYDLDNVSGGVSVELSTDGGLRWSPLSGDPLALNWYNDTSNGRWAEPSTTPADGNETYRFRPTRHTLTGAAGSGLAQVRLVFDARGSQVASGVGIDDVRAVESYDDVSVQSTNTQTYQCDGAAGATVSAEIRNDGNQEVTDLAVEYAVDGGSPVSETVPGPIAPGATVTHTFATPLAATAPGAHELSVTASLAGDLEPSNDTATAPFFGAALAGYPYQTGFEQDDAQWVGYGGLNEWQWGEPKTAAMRNQPWGTNAWVTNLVGNAARTEELSYLLSPCFDLTSASADPQVGLLLNVHDGSSSLAWLEMTANGEDWTLVGAQGEGQNWYNYGFREAWRRLPEWTMATNQVAGAAGQRVQFRLVFEQGDWTEYEGVGLSEFRLADAIVDVGVLDVAVPEEACALAPTITVANFGTAPVSNLPVSYTAAGQAQVMEVVAGPIEPGTSVTYTFTTTIESPSSGQMLEARAQLTGDVSPDNDVATGTLGAVPAVYTVGYSEDFEGDNGGWTAGGTGGSWSWGAPSGTAIANAAGGVSAWVTNLSGNYNDSEDSWLQSPCFDFTGESNDPLLSFDRIIDTEANFDGGFVEVTFDGVTWTKLGQSGDSPDWYNNSSSSRQWWDGPNGSWTLTSHALDGAAGQLVRMRYRFNADGGISAEGMGVDNVSITAQ